MAKKKTEFWESAQMNNYTFRQYYNRLLELAISRFEWYGLPKTIDVRYLELCLFSDGHSVFFKDEELGFLALRCALGGRLNVYRIPMNRRAYAANGYNRQLDYTNSVVIFNNNLHTNSMLDLEMFSKRLYNLDRAIDVNANAQKTPVLILCDENQRLTMENLYQQFDGNRPFIFGDKSINTTDCVKALNTGAPFVADKLYQLKTEIWNEALTYLGISNVNIMKKERLITDEVNRSVAGSVASRYSALQARKYACEQINEMFGLNVDVAFRENIEYDLSGMDKVEVGDEEVREDE